MAKKNQRHSIKENLSTLGEAFSIFILDPLFFGFVIYMLFERIRAIIEFTTTNPQYSFSQVINKDMEMNPLFYMAFAAVLFLWWLAKSIQHRNEVRNNKAILNRLDDISKKLDKLAVIEHIKDSNHGKESRETKSRKGNQT